VKLLFRGLLESS